MLRRSAQVVALIAVATLAHAERAAPQTLGTLPVETLRLPNGLDVVLSPDPSATNVVVHLRYGGGAGNEEQSGYTHLVEHLMFLGSVHVKSGDYDARIDTAGGFTGAVVGTDDLVVYEQVPPGAIDLALFLEAERMAGLADGITDEGVASARDTVLGEIQAMYAPNGYGLVERAVRERLWPKDHPNRIGTYGDAEVVKRATRESLRPFVRERIHPRNATLVITGAFELATTKERVRTYFGWIPDHRPALEAPSGTDAAPRTTPATTHVFDPAPKLVVAYRLPSPHDPDLLALEIAARILSGSRGAWLDNSMMSTSHEVTATVVRYANSAELQIMVTPPIDERDVSEAYATDILTAMESLANGRLAERAPGAIEQYETDLFVALEGLVFRADTLSRWHVEGENTLGTLSARLHAITPAAVKAAAKKWLGPDAHVIVTGDTR